MSYFLRELEGDRVCTASTSTTVSEDRKSARRLRKLLYKCAENTCKPDILRVPAYCGKNDQEDEAPAKIQINFHDILNSKFVVGPPSPFALVAIAKSILARFGSADDLSESNYRPEEYAGSSRQDEEPKTFKNTDQLVGTSLTCIFEVLEQLSRRDAELCVQALDSLLSLIQSMPIECLRSENRLSMSAMINVLKSLREDACPSVSSRATSCLIALVVACGEPEYLSCTIRSLICMKKNVRMSADSTYDMIQMPENLRKLLLKVRRKALGGGENGAAIPHSWSQIDVHEHSVASCFSLPCLPDTSPASDTPDDDNRIHSSMACDGSFLYILNYVGLYKLGTGLNDTIAEKLYAANQSLKSSKNVQMYLCNGSLYLRRNYSSCISVIDTDSLVDIGEVILPPNCVQHALFTDGTYFYSATLIANSTLSTLQLNDSFSPSNEPSSRKSYRLTDVKFTSYGDIQNPHRLPEYLPPNLHPQTVDLHITKEVAFIQARSGKVYYAGNGTRFGLHETGNNWMELCLPEPVVQISVGVDTIMFRSGAGHSWIANVDERKRNGRLRRLIAPNRRKTVHVCAYGHVYGYVTENGKVFMGGLHTMRVNASTQMLCGLDNVHISTLAFGKTHAVAVSRSGHLFTWGLNNMNQCGRVESASVNTSPRHSSRPEYQICPIGGHTWVNDTPSVCGQCGLCSARGVACGRIPRARGTMCHCGAGESTCLRCGLCRPCGEITEPAQPGRMQHVQFSSTAVPQKSTLHPARLLLSKGPHDVKVSSVSCGNFHTVLLASDRRVFTFGSNCHGQLGVGDTLSKIVPQHVSLPTDTVIVQVAAGANHTVLRANDGSVFTFGAFGKGQLSRPAGEKVGWNATPGRVPGFGPGFSAFAGWIGAVGDSTVIHSHTALLSTDNVLKAQIVANKTNIFIFPREVGKDYIVIRRKLNLFEHHVSDYKCWYPSWATDPKYDMLWYYNSAEMEIKGYDIFKKTDQQVEDAFDSLTFLAGTEFAVQVYDSPAYATSITLGMQLLSVTYSANVINLSDFWKGKNNEKDDAEKTVTDGYSVANRFEGTGGGWGYSAHSIEAIQFKVSKEIRLVGVGLYGGRGEYISKLKLYRLMGAEADELYVEQITETDETMYDCGAHETATLLFSQPIVIQPNQWHVVSAKISGPSSDCGANGRHSIECDGVTFQFRNSVVSNNGTDVNVGQIPELYYQLSDCSNDNHDDGDSSNKQLSMSRDMSNIFSPGIMQKITAEGIDNILALLEWAIQRIQIEEGVNNETQESAEKHWEKERAGFIAILCMRMLSRFVRTIYKEHVHQDEPGIDFANKIVKLHSTLLEFFFSTDMSQYENRFQSKKKERIVEDGYALMQCVSEAVKLFVSLSHCFMGSRNLVNAHLIAVMSRAHHDTLLLTSAVIGSLAKTDRIAHQLLSSNYNNDTFPMLSSLLLKHFNCEKDTLASLTSFPNILRFLYDQTFMRNAYENTSLLAESIVVKISRELSIPVDDGIIGPVVHQTSSRFRKRSAQPTWDMSDGCADAIAFRVDSEGVKLHGFGLYLPLEIDRRSFTGEIFMLSPDSSEKWTCLLRVTAEMATEEKEVGIVKFPDSVLLSPGVTYAIKVNMLKNSKTFCGEGGVTQVRLLNGARLFFSGCSMSQNGTTVQRGQLPFLLYSILDQTNSIQITQETIHDTFTLLLRLLSTKIGAAIAEGGNLPACCQHLISHISPHVMVFMERFPEKSLEIMSTLEQLIPMVSNLNGVQRIFHSYDSDDSGCDVPHSAIVTTIVESQHPYKPNTSGSTVVFIEDADYVCVRFSPDCQTAQFDDQLTIYLKMDEHSYMPVERCYGNEWPSYPMILPGNCLLFVLDASSAVEGATSEQMFGYHVTVTGYLTGYNDTTMRLEQDLVWLSANACRIMTQLPINPRNIEHLSTSEDDTRHLFEKHGSLLKKGLNLSHTPTLSELCSKGQPAPAQSPDLLFLREFLSGHQATSAGFLAKWLPTGPVVDASKCLLSLSNEEMKVGKAITLKLLCRDQYDREVDCPKLKVEIVASLGHKNVNANTAHNLPLDNLPSSLLIQQNPFQPIIVNHTRYMNIAAMPAFANYSVEEIRLGFMKEELVKDKIPLKPIDSATFIGSWTPTTAGSYRIECKVDGYEISHTYTLEVSDRMVRGGHDNAKAGSSLRGAQMAVAQTASVPFSSNFSGIRMRLGATLASTCVGVIPRGALIEFIEEIENGDGKWIRLTDETTLLYGCSQGSGPIWCMAYHKALDRVLIPLEKGDKKSDKENVVKLRKKQIEKESNGSKHHSVSIDASETYILSPNDILQVYSAPAPHSMIEDEKINGPCDLLSSGWLANRHGVWIKLSGVEKYVLQKNDPSSETSLSFSTNGNDEEDLERPIERRNKKLPNALTPNVSDCIRAVFAAFVWHEHLVKDLMAAAAYLRFHQNLHNIWQSCEIPSCTNAPAALQPIVKIWREICEVVETSVEQHLIMPPVSNKTLLSESLKQSSTAGGCELCDANITVPLTVHLRMAHPGCGGDCLGYGYNSNGKFTTGWSGECGTGGKGQSPWYLLCNNCRSHYLRKTPAGYHQERTRRWREFRFSTSASDARPEVIIRQNALFLLDLNNRLQTESSNSSTATSGWTINLFPTHLSTPSTLPRSQRRLDVPQTHSAHHQAYMKIGYSSDPGPKGNFIMSPPEQSTDQSASLNRQVLMTEPTEVLQSPSAALRTLFTNTNPSTSALLKRPVLAFCVEHHDLKRLRAACVQSVRRAVSFAHAFRVWNWLLRLVSSEYSVSDIILQYLTSLTSYNRLAEYMFAAKKNSNILPHPWRLCFLAGPIAAEMVTQLHAFLHTISIILQSAGVDGRLKSLCFKSWTLQLTAQEQDLLILTCNILGTVGGILSDTSILESDVRFVKEMKDITKFAKITASSRQAMVICLTDESGETFWESGEEDKNRSRSLVVQLDESSRGEILCLFIDNARDDGYRISVISFKAILDDGRRKDLTTLNLDTTYSGWVKCCIKDTMHIQIQFKGPSPASRIRQISILGYPNSGISDQKLVPSNSHHLLFNDTQRDAFALFQAISSQAFCGELTEDDTLRERVIDLLFSRVQLFPLQNYVYNQVIQAMEKEVEMLCDKSKRNYSYCCGLMSLLVRICDSRGNMDSFGQKSSALTSITQLLIFAPVIVQRQCLNSLECIFPSFSPSNVEVSKTIRNLLVVIGKVIQLQVRDKVAHTVVTVHLCPSVLNAPQSWRVDKPVDTDIGRQTALLVENLCNGNYSEEWASAVRCELANCLLSLIQIPESVSYTETLSGGMNKAVAVVGSKRFWTAISSLALIKSKSWLELSDRWKTVQDQIDEEPVTLCENHDDGHTVAQVFCLDCDVALCKDCFTVMHLHKKNRNHGVKNLVQSNAQHDINIHQGCARMKFLNFLILFHGEALNGMVEVAADTLFPSTTSLQPAMQESSSALIDAHPMTCRFCGNHVPTADQNLDGTCTHEDCVHYAKTACQTIHSCNHFCGGIRNETECLPCFTCKKSDTTQDGDDVCVICFTERLGAAPCIRLGCGHIFHYHCVRMILEKRWNGPRIVFRFMHCPLCIQFIDHEGLQDLIEPLKAIRQEVIDKAKMRLEYDGLLTTPALTDPRSEFFNQPEEYALDRYMYVLCHKCKKAYFGGESRCQAALDSSQYNPEELLCGGCSDTSGVQVCPRHGVEYLEYKCRFCCSIAVYFCFGTTHFCAPCHDDFQRLMSLPKIHLPSCPVGPRSTPMEEQAVCPLKMNHPPTGEEFAMGCGICRNISTF
uniref:RCR-type E3 ubiquitin transferase n=1 Tax=Caenorhabditis japonica TaxID=281687 RepID=A0A8R1DYZ2_CAEJA